MTSPRELRVQPTNEVRARLNKITAEFDQGGADADPVVFGSHRRPQAVLLSWAAWTQLQSAANHPFDVGPPGHDLEAAT